MLHLQGNYIPFYLYEPILFELTETLYSVAAAGLAFIVEVSYHLLILLDSVYLIEIFSCISGYSLP